MAEKTNRLPQNVPGPYYVDDSCIDCDLCRTTAPDFFRRNDEIGFSVVYRQPVTPEARSVAEEARQGCPTESIGSDGGDDESSVAPSAQAGCKYQDPCASAATGRVS
jgi:ferredoxin